MNHDALQDTIGTVPSGRPSDSVDPSVLARERNGDPAAHALLYERFAVDVMTLARRMLGSRSRAEDVLQDTFVEVIRGIARFRSEADVGTWIHRIAVNKCLSLLRSRWWDSRLDLDDADSLPASQGQASVDAMLELERLLDALPALARAVVWLHDGEGYTHAEIAALMGKSESFSKSQLQRAHKRIRAGLAADEYQEVGDLCASAVKPI